MQALVWEAPRQMVLREQPEPSVGHDQALIRVAYAGICGSELGGYLGHNALRVPPLIMGHEFSGEIVALGQGAKERNPEVEIGQRVTVFPFSNCGECTFCGAGLEQLCVSRQLVGAHSPGAFADRVAVRADQVFLLPDDMTLRTGAIAEPVACGVRIGVVAGDVRGRDCLIVGAGPMGLLSLQAFQRRGAANVWVADLDPQRLEMAAALGGVALDARSVNLVDVVRGATSGRGVSVAVDAVGTAQTRQQCVAATTSTGTVVLSGLHQETSEIPVADVIRREITLRGSFAYSRADFAEAIRWLAEGQVGLDPWIVEAPLAEGGQWFEYLLRPQKATAKVLLAP